jgi:hypothetical protein
VQQLGAKSGKLGKGALEVKGLSLKKNAGAGGFLAAG